MRECATQNAHQATMALSLGATSHAQGIGVMTARSAISLGITWDTTVPQVCTVSASAAKRMVGMTEGLEVLQNAAPICIEKMGFATVRARMIGSQMAHSAGRDVLPELRTVALYALIKQQHVQGKFYPWLAELLALYPPAPPTLALWKVS